MKNKIITSLVALCVGSVICSPSLKVEAKESEMRAAWISTVHNIDFPKTKNNVTAQKNEYIAILDKLKSIGLNTVVVQVRPKADALYESDINPWSDVLTGTQGKYPGYDPMEFMIEEAHKRGMEFHAWLNPYRVTTSGTDVNALDPNHPARKNPKMVFAYNNALYYDPASKDVQNHIADTVKEIVQKYKVDAIHFDDYFYPDKYPLPDGEDKDGPVANQRRKNVNDMVSLVSSTIKKTNPNVKFGISPIGIWKNNYPDKTGSATKGNESYYAVYADTRTWIKNGWIDYVVPQIYWNIGHDAADYKVLVEWWANEVKGTGVDLYIGQGIYKEEVANEIKAQLELNKKYPEIKGSMFFTTRDIINNVGNCFNSIKEYYNANPTTPDIDVEDSSNSGEIVTYNVNLRKNADYSSEILEVISVGEKVEILSYEGAFTKIKYNNKVGYVDARYVKKVNGDTIPEDKPETKPEELPQDKPETPTVTTKKGTVINATVLNIRSGPGTSYSIVEKLKNGDVVNIIESKNGWHRVNTASGKTGWVSGDYIKISTTNNGDTSSSGGTNTSSKSGVVTANTLNVRSGAGTNYSIVTKLSKGTKVSILETKNGWHKISISGGKTGWVSADYINISTSSNNTGTSTNTKVVTATVLNIRSGAGTNYSIVTKVNKGDKLTIIETKSGWSKVKTPNGKTGWASNDYLK